MRFFFGPPCSSPHLCRDKHDFRSKNDELVEQSGRAPAVLHFHKRPVWTVSLVNGTHVHGTLTDRGFESRPSLMRLMPTVLPVDKHNCNELGSCSVFVVRDYETNPQMSWRRLILPPSCPCINAERVTLFSTELSLCALMSESVRSA